MQTRILGYLLLFLSITAIAYWPIFINKESQIVFIAVGQGDCVLIKSLGRNILIDTGPKSENFDAGRRLALPELKKYGVRQIDLLVLSHNDFDHIGGTKAISDAIPILHTYATEDVHANPNILSNKNLGKKVSLTQPETLSLANIKIKLFPGLDGDDNNRSILVQVDIDGAKYLSSGDGDSTYEEKMINNNLSQYQLIKAGHHGSGNSNSTKWLNTLNPENIVITCGRGNNYGHPSQFALDRMKLNGSKIWRTDQQGSVRFVIKNGRFEPESAL